MAEKCQLAGDMDTVFAEVAKFFEGMMKGETDGAGVREWTTGILIPTR